MGIFDWIPTVEEATDWVECRLTGHVWIENENATRQCKNCGKRA